MTPRNGFRGVVIPGRSALAAAALLAALTAMLPACAPRREAPTTAERTQALLDAGNASYAAKDYESAAKRYASAAVDDPGEPAAFYGLGMALAKLGRDEESRAAYAKARDLSRRKAQSGAH